MFVVCYAVSTLAFVNVRHKSRNLSPKLRNSGTKTHTMEQEIIIYYMQYAYNILLILNSNKIIPKIMLEMVNNHHESLKSTLTQETNNQIAYLELNISNTKNSIKVEIYQKPTAADTIVNNQSCHPGDNEQQKWAVFIYTRLLHMYNC
jgi:hypothetical protein